MRTLRTAKPAADPVAPPSLTPEYAIATLTMLLGLFATQGLITNGTDKLITGIASVVVPLVFVIVQAVLKAVAHKAKLALAVTGVLPLGATATTTGPTLQDRR